MAVPHHDDVSALPTIQSRYTAEQMAAFYADGYWGNTTLLDVFDRWILQQPDKTLIADGSTSLSWSEVKAQADALATWLSRHGIGRLDRVVVQIPNWSEMAVAVVAIVRLGAILVPTQPVYRHAELRHIIDDSSAKAVIAAGPFRGFDHTAMMLELGAECPSLAIVVSVRPGAAGVIRGAVDLASITSQRAEHQPSESVAWPAPDPDEGFAILYSSGTTAAPKGCLHTWNTLGFSVREMAANWEIGENDVAFVPSPVGHGTGMLCGILIPILTGSSTVLLDHWTAKAGLQVIEQHGCTWTVTATTFLTMLLDADGGTHDLHSLRAWVMGGAPIPPAIVNRTVRRLPRCRVLSLYGRSENFTVAMCRISDAPERAVTSDGRALDGVEIAITSPAGLILPQGELGDVSYRGPGHMIGYLNNPELTAQMFTQDGFSRSGDLGRLDEDSFLRITGRSTDMIVRGGLNISATEVEEHLRAHPRVSDAAVVSMPDKRLGERACVYVVPRDNDPMHLGELTAFLAEDRKLATPKLPERLEIVSEFPTNATGKVLKAVLRDRIRQALLAEARSAETS